MKAYVGTSGWAYSWNEGGTLDWYIERSGLNAIELNTSFYRFPFPSQVKSWTKKGTGLAWAVKVNQLITHRFKLNERSHPIFRKFLRLFKPLDHLVRFYLFQLPPMLTPNSLERVAAFASKFDLGDRLALEARNVKWFSDDVYDRIKRLGITMVSVDSPRGTFFMKTSKRVYLRVHGRTDWYDYTYSDREIAGMARRIKALKPASSYVMFNNDHGMLANGRMMLKAL